MPTVRFQIVDVFTDTPFQGNQLGVFTDARQLTPERMQELTRELGFSECTFVLPPVAGGHARVRIFTPAEEIPFAGHPVLGTAFVLAGPMSLGAVELETGVGLVPVVLEREGARIVSGRMTQPLPSVEPHADPEGLLAALGVATSELPVETYDNGVRHTYVMLASEEEVAAVRPDMARLVELRDEGVSCFAADGARVKTRMFAPAFGVPEDPATGSAAGPLAVHLARHGRIAWGDEIEISQGAEIGRPSTLWARAEGGEAGATRVEVAGGAVVVARGEFAV